MIPQKINFLDAWIDESSLPLTDAEILDDAKDILYKSNIKISDNNDAYWLVRFARAMQRSGVRHERELNDKK